MKKQFTEAVKNSTEFHALLALILLLCLRAWRSIPKLRPILHGFINRVTVKKENNQFIGSIEYFLPPLAELLRPPDPPPPFDPAPTGKVMSPKRPVPVGAPLYRQHYQHPLLFKKRPR